MEFEPIKKTYKSFRKIIGISISIIVLVLTIGVTYSMYTKNISGHDTKVVVGDIYMRYINGQTKQISMIPSNTYNENDYYEFQINGKNTSDKDIVYDIVLNHGENYNNPYIRLNDKFLRFRLVTVSNNVETEVIDKIGYDSINNTTIHVDTIDKNGSSDVNTTYRLYTWVEGVKVGNVNQDYTTEQWSNVYTNINVSVTGDFANKQTTETILVEFTEANGKTTSKVYSEGETYGELPIPKREGYRFVGWYKEATCENEVTAESTIDVNNLTLYAKWEEVEGYVITLDNNGATNTPTGSISILLNTKTINPDSIEIPIKSYKVKGFELEATRKSNNATVSNKEDIKGIYSFEGWYTEINGGTKVLTNKANLQIEANVANYTDGNGNWIKNSDTTLYAHYTGGSVTLPTIEKTGYVCGWTTTKTGTTIEKQSGETYTPTENTTLYGVCEGNELVFENQTINKTYSENNQTANITGASNGTGHYSYSEVSEKNSSNTSTNYISITGTTITIAGDTPADTYTYVIRATDTESEKIKDATYTIIVEQKAATNSIEITGTNTWGNTLTATITTNSNGTKGYQWYYTTTEGATSGGTAISGATSNTYIVAKEYVGKYLYVVGSVGSSTNYTTPNNSVAATTASKNTTSAVAKKASCDAPSNVSIGTDGKVTWTASSTANGYQISIDDTTYTDATSGIDYKNTIIGATGNRIVYVRSKCDTTYYINSNSASVNAQTTVYSVALTKGTGISAVSGEGNYITGSTVTIGATVSDGYTWSKWKQTSGGQQVSPTNSYSETITSDWNYTAEATINTYTIGYTLNGGTATNPSSYTVETNTFTLNNPTKTGYNFTGWTGSNGSTAQTSVSITKGTKGNKTYTANYIVDAISNISFTSTSNTIKKNNTATTSLTYNGTAKTIAYSSNNTSVATVNSSTGVITAIGTGNATITVTLTDYENTVSTKSINILVPTGAQQIMAKLGTDGLIAVNTNGQLYDATDQTQTIREYRYSGGENDVKNYIWFNNENWRIVGIFDGKIKIVKDTPIESAPEEYTNKRGTAFALQEDTYTWEGAQVSRMHWNLGGGTRDAYNDWSEAGLQYYLNDETTGRTIETQSYYDKMNGSYKGFIDSNTTYYLGNVVYYRVTPSMSYTQERDTSSGNLHSGNPGTWTGKIGLLYPSDWGYATDPTVWNGTSTEMEDYGDRVSNIKTKNWILKSCSYYSWFLSPSSDGLKEQLYWNYSGPRTIGSLNNLSSTGFANVYPVLSLKSDTVIVSGEGTSGNPYRLIAV